MTALYPRLLELTRALQNPDGAAEPPPRPKPLTDACRVARPSSGPPVMGEDLCARLLRQCLTLTQFEGGAMLLSDADRNRAYLSAYRDLPPELLQLMASGSDPLGLLGKFNGEPELIDLSQHPSAGFRTALSLFSYQHLLLLPLNLSWDQPGIVLLVTRDADPVPPEFNPRFLSDVCGVFQRALDDLALRARIHRNLDRYREVEAGLSELGRSANPEGLLQNTCEQVRRIFKSTVAWIGLVETHDGAPVSVSPRMVSGAPDALLSGLRRDLRVPGAPPALVTALQERAVVVMNTTCQELLLPEVYDRALADSTHPLHRIAELDAMPSTLAAPMLAAGDLVGVLVLHQDRSYRFDAEDHRVVRIFAQEAGLAVRTQSLLDEAAARADALETSEGRYRSFVRQISDAMFRLSPEGVVEEVSDFGIELLGADRETIVGQPLSDRVATTDRPLLEEKIAEAAAGASCELDVTVARDGGASRVATVRLGPLTLKDRVAGVIGVARDETHRRALQGRLLMREKLASVGLLSAGVAHEIYNPLSILVSNLELLDEDLRLEATAARFGNAERLEMLRECGEGTSRIRTIVANLRQFSLEGSDVDFQAIDLNGTVESATWMVYLRARTRTHIQLDLDPDVALVECLPGQIVQSVAQLLSNAIRASLLVDRTVPEVLLQTRRDTDYVEIRVIDRGCGIEPDLLSRVAEPFFTTHDDGAGVGLTIVLQTAERHGGTLRLRSSPDEGTEATLVLPLRQSSHLRRAVTLDVSAAP